MRVKGNISEFEMRIESKKTLFKLPEFDEREFEFMLSKAKKEAVEEVYDKKFVKLFDKYSVYNFFEGVIFSPRVAAMLIFTILAVSMICYNNSLSLFKSDSKATTAQVPEVHAIDKNTRIPINNNNVMVISTYTEKHF